MAESTVDNRKRRFLLAASSALGGVGVIGVAVPFVASMFPSARARAAGAPVEVDISRVEPGMMSRAEWRGKPIWVVRRTPEMLDDVRKSDPLVADPNSDHADQPQYAKNEFRAIK